VTDLDVGEPHIANLCAVPARNPPLDLTAGPHLFTLCDRCSRCVTATGPRPGAHADLVRLLMAGSPSYTAPERKICAPDCQVAPERPGV